MRRLFVFTLALISVAHAQTGPIIAIDNLVVTHEQKGWRVVTASTAPVPFNFVEGDLIVRIDGKNAGDAGPMIFASLLNQSDRRQVPVFLERGKERLWTNVLRIKGQDLNPVGTNPFRHVASGFSAPDLSFKDIDNRPLTLAQFNGKWLLVEFGATWCAPCMQALPVVLDTVTSRKLNLLFVAVNDRAPAVRALQKKYSLQSPVVLASNMSELPISFGITTAEWTGQIPSFVLIRPDGEVAMIAIGWTPDDMNKTLDSMMGSSSTEAQK